MLAYHEMVYLWTSFVVSGLMTCSSRFHRPRSVSGDSSVSSGQCPLWRRRETMGLRPVPSTTMNLCISKRTQGLSRMLRLILQSFSTFPLPILVGDWNMTLMFPFNWEIHHPNWQTHTLQRGRRKTSNQKSELRWVRLSKSLAARAWGQRLELLVDLLLKEVITLW